MIIQLQSRMSSDDHNATVQLAMNRLEKGILRILMRSGRAPSAAKSKRRIQTLLDHIQFLLVELFRKRQSLQSFLKWFSQEWKRIEPYLKAEPVMILEHSMHCFLRCQDGLVMLTSGECRHAYDIETAMRAKFPSKLATLKERNDGYTYLYKSDAVYSGYGWDEYSNETVGVKARLIAELTHFHSSPWEYLEKQDVTDILESLLDQQEGQVKELQRDLQILKNVMLADINKRLKPRNLKFATQDKMERLSLSFQGRCIDLARRADSFQIEGSLLPENRLLPEDWKSCALKVDRHLRHPPNSNRKRRRVIAESDSENGEDFEVECRVSGDTTTRPGSSSGLVVRDERLHTFTEMEDSIATIKLQMGIDTQGLENARVSLEDEGTFPVILYEIDKITRCKNILRRAISQQYEDDNEVWDARECLREALMEAGNFCLWTSKDYSKAIDLFNEANGLVEEQNKAHHESMGNSIATECEALFIQRNLLYLKAQATINTGIALIEFAQHEKTAEKVQQGIKEVEKGRILTNEIRDLARATEGNRGRCGRLSVEEMYDVLKADRLDSMGCRWVGLGMWRIGQHCNATQVLEKASLYYCHGKNIAKWHASLEQELLELAAECIYATCVLADLASQELVLHEETCCWKKGDDMLTVVSRATTRYLDICAFVEALQFKSVSNEYFFREYDILLPKDVIAYREQIEGWWRELKGRQGGGGFVRNFGKLERLSSSISVNSPSTMMSSRPTSNSILSFKLKRQLKRNETRKGFGNESKGPTGATVPDGKVVPIGNTGHRRPLEFRQWGDDLCARVSHSTLEAQGEKCQSFPYPCGAPLIPDEFKHLQGI